MKSRDGNVLGLSLGRRAGKDDDTRESEDDIGVLHCDVGVVFSVVVG